MTDKDRADAPERPVVERPDTEEPPHTVAPPAEAYGTTLPALRSTMGPSRPGAPPEDALPEDAPPEDAPPEDAVDPHLRDQVLAGLFPSHSGERRRIDRFPIFSRLGAGGMGVVYSGYDEELDRRVAIKLVRSPHGSDAELYSRRLLREAKTMAKLDHPNVVQVYQAGLSDDRTFIVMEFIRGRTLADWFTAPPKRSWREIVGVFVQAGRGLAAAHAAGIVHRDFKPANVMIDDQGVVKVLDFGLAQAPDGASPEALETEQFVVTTGAVAKERLTRTGALLGTPAYMAPEQHDARPATDKSDQFSYCTALYEALYGQLPFAGESMTEMIVAVLEGRVSPPPPGHRVPQWVHQIVLRGLSVDPQRRYPSMGALLDALGRDSVARRRRRLGLGAAFAGIGLLGFGLATAVNPPEEPAACGDAREELVNLWDPARRDALGRALRDTGVAYAGEIWERITPQIDAYADAWVAMRQQACQAHLEARQSSVLYDRRNACLDQRLAGLTALLELLGSADAGMIDKVPTAVVNLPSIAFCGNTEALLADVPPPEDPAVAAEVQQLRRQIEEARAYEQLGRYAEGLERIEDVVARAEALDHAPLEAEALLLRGYLQQEGATPQDAIASLSAARLRGIAGDHPEVVAEAMIRRMLVRGEWMGERERALHDVPEIEAVLERLPYATGLRGIFLNDRATLQFYKGEFERAVELYEESLATKRAAFGEQHLQVALTLANLARLHHAQGAYRSGSAALTQARSIASKTLGPRHPMIASLMMAVHGEILLEQGCSVEARSLLEQAVAILDEGTANVTLRVLPLLLALGRLELHDRNFGTARDWFERARSVGESTGITQATIAPQHGLGDVEIALGQVARGLERHERVLQQVQAEFGDTPLAVVYSLHRLADAERSGKRFERALEHCEQALVLLERAGQRDNTEVGRVLVSLGHAQAGAGRLSEANRTFERALELRARHGVAGDDFERARIQVAQGRVLLDLSRAAEATAALEQASSALLDQCPGGTTLELATARFTLARALLRLDASALERARQLSEMAASALAQRGEGFAPEAAAIDAWRREQGWR